MAIIWEMLVIQQRHCPFARGHLLHPVRVCQPGREGGRGVRIGVINFFDNNLWEMYVYFVFSLQFRRVLPVHH